MSSDRHFEKPSLKKLLVSTGAAFIVALILLVLVVMPAEYGVDPTGVGGLIGLTEMGKVKMALADEAHDEGLGEDVGPCDEEAEGKVENETDEDDTPLSESAGDVEDEATQAQDTIQILLAPGEAAEIKLVMQKDSVVEYSWSVDQGHLNYDLHADSKTTKYYGYTKGSRLKTDAGELKAAFDGSHGWFWRNRSGKKVQVTLRVKGAYSATKRVL